MKEFKGTKGEWKFVEWKGDFGQKSNEIQYGEDGECVAEHVANKHDAQLIASAPELLEALIHANTVLKSMADRGLYPLEVLDGEKEYLGKAGFQFMTKAINKALGE